MMMATTDLGAGKLDHEPDLNGEASLAMDAQSIGGRCSSVAADPVHFGFTVSNSSLGDLSDVALFDEILTGRFPHAWGHHGPTPPGMEVPPAQKMLQFFPAGARLTRSTTLSGGVEVFVSGAGYRAQLFMRGGWHVIRVAAEGPQLAADVGGFVAARLPAEERENDPAEVAVRCWTRAPRGTAQALERVISAPTWSGIASNYPAATRAALGRLMGLSHTDANLGARLILLTGPPGTGKSMAIRALARQWAPWSSFESIEEPDRVFSEAAYLCEIINHGGEERPYRTLVIEDADHYLRTKANHDGEAALGRLLNFADGWLGSERLLLLLSANTPATKMQPALLRPGRCLARVSFELFTPSEARSWLGGPSPGLTVPTSLAELFKRRGRLEMIGDDGPAQVTGQYL